MNQGVTHEAEAKGLTTTSGTGLRVMALVAGWRSRVQRYLFGHDIFISYARADGAAYANALGRALMKRGFACWIDQLGSWPGLFVAPTSEPGAGTLQNFEPPPHLLRALVHSSMLVVLATQKATQSRPVGAEIEAFRGTNERVANQRGLCVIDLDGALSNALWANHVYGVAPIVETTAARDRGPSEEVVRRIIDMADFVRLSRRRARAAVAFGVALLGAAALAGAMLVTARVAQHRAADADLKAGKAVRRADDAANRASSAENRAGTADKRAEAAINAENEAEEGARKAEENARQANENTKQAEVRSKRAQAAEQKANATSSSMDLAASARAVFRDDPSQGTQRALAAVEIAPAPDAIRTLREHLASFVPRRAFLSPGDEWGRGCVTSDFRHILTSDGPVRVFDLDGTPPQTLNFSAREVQCARRSAILLGSDQVALWFASEPGKVSSVLRDAARGSLLDAGFAPDENGFFVTTARRIERYNLGGRLLSEFEVGSDESLERAALVAGPARAVISVARRPTASDSESWFFLLDMRLQKAKEIAREATDRFPFDVSHDGRFLTTEGKLWSVLPTLHAVPLPSRLKSFSPDDALLGLVTEAETPPGSAPAVPPAAGLVYADPAKVLVQRPPRWPLFSEAELWVGEQRDAAGMIIYPKDSRTLALGLLRGLNTAPHIEVRDPNSSVLLADFPTGTVGPVQISPGARYAFGSNYGSVYLWDVLPGGVPRSRMLALGKYFRLEKAVFSADGLLLALVSTGFDGSARITTVRWTETSVPSALEPPARVDEVSLGSCASGSCLVLLDGSAKLQRLESNGTPPVTVAGAAPGTRIAASRDAAIVVGVSSDKLLVWENEGGQPRTLEVPGLIKYVESSPDGVIVAVSEMVREATHLVSTRDGKVLGEEIPASHGAFDATGRRFLGLGTAGGAPILRVWESPNNEWNHWKARDFTGSPGKATYFEWSDDGRFALTVAEDGVRVWDTALGNLAWRRVSTTSIRPLAAAFVGASLRIVSLWSTGALRVDTCEVCRDLDELKQLARERLGFEQPRSKQAR